MLKNSFTVSRCVRGNLPRSQKSFQMGIPEAIVHCINQCEPSARRWLYQNIVLTGGCANIPNFRARVERDVRELAPDHYQVRFMKCFI